MYLTTAVPDGNAKDQLLRVISVDAESGQIVWDKEVFRQDGKKRRAFIARARTPTPRPFSTASGFTSILAIKGPPASIATATSSGKARK